MEFVDVTVDTETNGHPCCLPGSKPKHEQRNLESDMINIQDLLSEFSKSSFSFICFSVSPMKQKLLLNEERGACNGKSHASRIQSKSLSHPLGISLVVSRHVLGTVQ